MRLCVAVLTAVSAFVLSSSGAFAAITTVDLTPTTGDPAPALADTVSGTVTAVESSTSAGATDPTAPATTAVAPAESPISTVQAEAPVALEPAATPLVEAPLATPEQPVAAPAPVQTTVTVITNAVETPVESTLETAAPVTAVVSTATETAAPVISSVTTATAALAPVGEMLAPAPSAILVLEPVASAVAPVTQSIAPIASVVTTGGDGWIEAPLSSAGPIGAALAPGLLSGTAPTTTAPPRTPSTSSAHPSRADISADTTTSATLPPPADRPVSPPSETAWAPPSLISARPTAVPGDVEQAASARRVPAPVGASVSLPAAPTGPSPSGAAGGAAAGTAGVPLPKIPVRDDARGLAGMASAVSTLGGSAAGAAVLLGLLILAIPFVGRWLRSMADFCRPPGFVSPLEVPG